MLPSMLRLLALLFVVTGAAAQPTTLRIATYNLLKYPNSDSTLRNAALRTVVGAMQPHVLVAQEIESPNSVRLFGDDVLDRALDGRFAAAPFVDVSSDTEGAFFYDTTRVTYLGMHIVHTELRGIFGYRFAVNGTTDTVWIFTVHLRASDSQADAAQRAREAQQLRAHLDTATAGRHVVVAGDFNVYRSSEPALGVLMSEEGNAEARLIDPLASVGDWHANPDFASIHTQSPRVRSFGGGITGGLDDRFDLILISTSLSSIIDRGTYTAFGNDGQHLNDSINEPPNLAVPDSVAQALHDGSDHLPVFADFRFGVAAIASERARWRVDVAPNPASDLVRFDIEAATSSGTLVIRHVDGSEVARIVVEPGTDRVTWSSRGIPSGLYVYILEGRDRRSTGTLAVIR